MPANTCFRRYDLPSEESLAQTAISAPNSPPRYNTIQHEKLWSFRLLPFWVSGTKAALAPMFKAGLPERYYEALLAGRGRVIFASSRNTEYSYVLPGGVNSLFTQHLLTGLRGGVASDDVLSASSTFSNTCSQVTGDQPNQHPIFKAEIEENFPVALYSVARGLVPRIPKASLRCLRQLRG